MEMIDIEAALDRVLEKTRAPQVEQANFGTALGRVLAEDVTSDIDTPPFDKSMMDGFAVHVEDVQEVDAELALIGTLTAGQVPTGSLSRGSAMRIMTGAMIPEGADAVIPREQTNDPPSSGDTTTVVIREGGVQPGTNILKRATCVAKGQTVLAQGVMLRGCQIGMLAEQGHVNPKVYALPAAAVMATGNEIVTADQVPGPGKIRNTNGPMLTAILRSAGCNVANLGVAGDDAEVIERMMRQCPQVDILVVTGGVSAGDLDLLPGIFRKLQFDEVFHGVNLKPGKPMWFGRAPSGMLVFGLPGNPISSFVCAQLFIRPAVAKMTGSQDVLPRKSGRLQHSHEVRGDRRTFWPGMTHPPLESVDHGHVGIELLPWKGSSDLLTWQKASCMVDLGSNHALNEGDKVQYIELV